MINMKIKYNRISTSDQSLDRQQLNTESFDLTIDEVSSGSISFFDRKGGLKVLKLIDNNKVNEVCITAIDRIGRDIIDILSTVKYFTERKVNLFVENLGLYSMIDGKPNPTFKLIVSVLGNVAELERLSMLERQKIGIQIARLKGKYKGRSEGTKQTKEQFIKKYQTAYNELEGGSTLKRASLLGECSIGTCQRLKRLLD